MYIAILDVGCSNLSSVKWAVQKLGYDVVITKNSSTILKSQKLLIPGVGTAKTAMQHLSINNLVEIIKNYKKPVLGICLGLQLFGTFSTEGSKQTISMLQIINESISLLHVKNLPLPHTGWNTVFTTVNNHFLLKGITKKSYFYFLHSYAMNLNKYTVAQTYYGQYFSSIIQKNNFFGVQFHPEKSGNCGSILLKNFLET
ncbi:imidazole glycerol phosphate synthase subunit [Buchnera aphidicola (Nipponaphis monzeni)]|uniref:Imidazole glycerol phosphate synthase subunit HisH n=1 Tax=Buchnera aphidicola (Nipponaphis monzeni) TaxID=2495405 RepID=A0A455T9U3_9GAMM|nr:imidazole glycerol phosphate synthase subunit HisH [Buchnera aphidicola]BBI01101.1 imidazole glycerol phosphate synthase subunit [Buchnera aphidicola (Nipponaphis monzeni)]